MEFASDGGGLAKGGDVTLFLDGHQVGQGRVERTEPMIFSAAADHYISPEERFRLATAIQ
jgi:hypothetical protein